MPTVWIPTKVDVLNKKYWVKSYSKVRWDRTYWTCWWVLGCLPNTIHLKGNSSIQHMTKPAWRRSQRHSSLTRQPELKRREEMRFRGRRWALTTLGNTLGGRLYVWVTWFKYPIPVAAGTGEGWEAADGWQRKKWDRSAQRNRRETTCILVQRDGATASCKSWNRKSSEWWEPVLATQDVQPINHNFSGRRSRWLRVAKWTCKTA